MLFICNVNDVINQKLLIFENNVLISKHLCFCGIRYLLNPSLLWPNEFYSDVEADTLRKFVHNESPPDNHLTYIIHSKSVRLDKCIFIRNFTRVSFIWSHLVLLSKCPVDMCMYLNPFSFIRNMIYTRFFQNLNLVLSYDV